MQLIEINKQRYRSHLNKVIIACIATLVIGSLAISQSLILFFPDNSGSHFHWNLTGVVISAFAVVYTLIKYKKHPFMFEVSYVWDLKQALNPITRKMKKLKQAAESGDKKAILAIQFSYSGSRQLWLLDDNTVTMSSLNQLQIELDNLIEKFQLEVDIKQYNASILESY